MIAWVHLQLADRNHVQKWVIGVFARDLYCACVISFSPLSNCDDSMQVMNAVFSNIDNCEYNFFITVF